MENIEKYRALISQFIKNEIDIFAFEALFLKMFKDEENDIPERYYLILDSLFGDLDMFCIDSSLREDRDLNEDDIRKSAEKAFSLLQE
ncbi:colicin immunity domain-containing protein [Flavobacterium quisquiliarum]|uniref:Colicin immunity domain-containing protein n=1 Tax=Flavobacterium quisquiliarum TaxID=1834436 RepID=A0ABV8W9A9_9FLAO|nr:colicin immunity domain-containing protein [Flavobacterium quisquiliarum]MBW1655358.1 hypothetical protein [Flavobacterium quisquiliarum]NWL00744.1 hypothetical protein [Flavobacterium collinsii]